MNPKAREFRERLEGALIPAVPVPFNAQREIDEEAQKRLVKYHADSAAAGVAIWVHTGRGLFLSNDERHRILKRWRIGLRDEQFIIAGAGCPRTGPEDLGQDLSDGEYIARATNMAQQAKIFGADAVLAYAPVKFRGRRDQDEMVVEYFESIAAIGLPIILFFLYEAAGGISYSLDLLKGLLHLQMVAGIKVATLNSVMTFQDIAGVVRTHAPEVALLSGEDRFLGYTLMRGCCGALIGMGAAAPDPQAEMIRAWREGRLERFHKLSEAVDAFGEATFSEPMEGYIQRMMVALEHEGVLPLEATYDPWGPPIKHRERAGIIAALEHLKKT